MHDKKIIKEIKKYANIFKNQEISASRKVHGRWIYSSFFVKRQNGVVVHQKNQSSHFLMANLSCNST